MTDKQLSPASQAVLTAVTQQEYCLDPSDIPNEAGRIGYLVAAALRVLVSECETWEDGTYMVKSNDILEIAKELE